MKKHKSQNGNHNVTWNPRICLPKIILYKILATIHSMIKHIWSSKADWTYQKKKEKIKHVAHIVLLFCKAIAENENIWFVLTLRFFSSWHQCFNWGFFKGGGDGFNYTKKHGQ